MDEVLRPNGHNARKIPPTYILTDKAAEPEKDGFFRLYERAAARGWTTKIMEGDHVVHVTQTNALVQLIEQVP